jgi:hypothetical protein
MVQQEESTCTDCAYILHTTANASVYSGTTAGAVINEQLYPWNDLISMIQAASRTDT